MRKTITTLAILLLVLSLFLTGVGGLADMLGVSRFGISKEHAWNDGIYLILVSISLLLLAPRV